MLKRNFLFALTLAGLMFCVAGSARAEQLTAYAVIGQVDTLLTFDSATPSVTVSRAITGLQLNESLRGIDYRPATGQLYALTNQSRLYTIDPNTGAATLAATLSVALTAPEGGFGIDFNPVVDRLRVVGTNGQNLRINVDTGATISDGTINPADRRISASAYSNNVAGATTTTLYGVDTSTSRTRANGTLVIQDPPNNGTVVDVGSLGLGFSIDEFNGFDISGVSGAAYATFNNDPSQQNNGNALFSINLATGRATFLGAIGNGTLFIEGLAAPVANAAAPVPEPATMLLLGTGLTGIATKVRRRRRVDDEDAG